MLSQLIDTLTIFVEQLLVRFDTPGIVLIALLENLFPLTPSELIYPLAGKMAYDGNLSLTAIILAGVLGSVIGALLLYTLGHKMGETRTRGFVARYGVIKFWRITIDVFSLESYDRAVSQFEKHGGRIVLLARLMPFIHGVISIPAGVVRMNLWAFVIYTAIGSALWIAPTVLLGYFLGSQWETVLRLLDAYETLWYIVIVLAILYFVVKRLRQHRQSASDDTESSEHDLAIKAE
ncbi:MAG: DedA family protein [Anaerolineae bacterium]|nr:DedA family protein [Anaerolineae bacterium]